MQERPPVRAAEKVAHELAGMLFAARLPEGRALVPEGELVKRLGCSRTALRGALRLLETWGLLTVQPGRNGGPIVRRPRADDLRPVLAALIHSRGASLADLMAARQAIEPVIAAQAARLRTDEQLASLRSTISQAYASLDAVDVIATTEADFYRLLSEAAGLTILGVFLSALASIGGEAISRITPDTESRRLRVIRSCERVVDTIERSDASGADAAMLNFQLEAEVFWRRFAPHQIDTPLRPLALLPQRAGGLSGQVVGGEPTTSGSVDGDVGPDDASRRIGTVSRPTTLRSGPRGPKRSSSRVADRLARRIALELLDGLYEVGRRLPVEKELIQQLSCSRQSLREALRLLEAWGLIEMKLGRQGGAIVRRPGPADIIDQLGVLAQDEEATIQDMFTARRAIEPMIAEAAALNATPEQIAQLGALAQRMSTSEELSYDQYLADALHFNRLLGEASGAVLLAYFLEALALVNNTWVMPQLPFDDARRHRLWLNIDTVIQAIAGRDPAGAREASSRARKQNQEYWEQRRPEVLRAPVTVDHLPAGVDPRSILLAPADEPDGAADRGPGRAERPMRSTVHEAPRPVDETPQSDLTPRIGKVARGELAHHGYTRYEHLTGVTADEVLCFHGVGPKALRILVEELTARGWSFAPAVPRVRPPVSPGRSA